MSGKDRPYIVWGAKVGAPDTYRRTYVSSFASKDAAIARARALVAARFEGVVPLSAYRETVVMGPYSPDDPIRRGCVGAFVRKGYESSLSPPDAEVVG